jgi:CSLREA domain-containing protein
MKWRRIRFCALFVATLGGTLLKLEAAIFDIANGDVAALSAAITTANGNGQENTINLAANGTYLLIAVDPNSAPDQPAGLPTIGFNGQSDSQHHLTLNGNNATIARSSAQGTPAFRIVFISGASEAARAIVNDVAFSNGFLTTGEGGAVRTAGLVTLNNCTIKNSEAPNGGGIASFFCSLVMNNCAIMGNTANGAGDDSKGNGGGLYNSTDKYADATVALNSCTFYNNTSSSVLVNHPPSGHIYNLGGDRGYVLNATIDLTSCTLSSGGVYNNFNGSTHTTITFRNSLFSFSSIDNAVFNGSSGSILSGGYNLSTDDNQGYFTQFTDRWNAHPKLDRHGPQFNGGVTPTIALCAGSDAIDHGSKFALTTDQRGFARPVDNPTVGNTTDGTDIGAYEAPADPLQYGDPYQVSTLADHDDGLCSGNDCTLREAIAYTNSVPKGGSETIAFAPSVAGTLTLAGNELVITQSVSIVGPGARLLAISANAQSRVLSLLTNPASPPVCSISGLTLRDGSVNGGPSSSNVGGGVYNEAFLTLNDCFIASNSVLGGAAAAGSGVDGGMARGGGIFNGGTLALNRCTIGGVGYNEAIGGDGASHLNDGVNHAGGKGGAGLGGAIYNDSNAGLTLNNCTIVNNTAAGGVGANGTNSGGGGAGGQAVGGIFNANGMTVTNTTITANSGFGGAGGHGTFTNGAAGKGVGGIHAESGTSTVRNSLIARNTRNRTGGPDADGTFVSGGFNLVGTSSGGTGFTNATDLTGTNAALLNPLLGPVQNNGGPTDTMALLTDSPALEHGSSFGLTTDQRGDPRPSNDPVVGNASGGDGSDIGAYESGFARATSIVRTGNPVTIHFFGSLGKRFRVERKTSLSDSWLAVSSFPNTVTSNGGLMQLTDNNASGDPKVFYRIRQLEE